MASPTIAFLRVSRMAENSTVLEERLWLPSLLTWRLSPHLPRSLLAPVLFVTPDVTKKWHARITGGLKRNVLLTVCR